MSILEWNSKWYASTESLQYDTASYTHLATAATSTHITSTLASQTASSLTQALSSETSNQAVASPGVAMKNSLTSRTRIGPVIGGLIGALCLCIGIAVLMAFHRRRHSNIRATKFWSCRVKAPIPGPEDTPAEMTEKPIIIPLQPTHSRGVISFDIASINEHGHSSAASRLTIGSETTAEFYVNSLNIPSPFSTNFRASIAVTRIRDLEEVDPSIRPGGDGSSTLCSYSVP